MSLKTIFGLIFLNSSLSFAADVSNCQWNECRSLQNTLEARISLLAKRMSPKMSDLVKDADGKNAYMTYAEAKAYCAQHGLKLPTARNWAMLAISMAAAGVTEKPRPNDVESVKYSTVEDDGTADLFYYKSNGYVPRAPYDSYFIVWSSSLLHSNVNKAYVFNNGYGQLFEEYREARALVRCAKL